ncbi:MAG: hypothetical protein M3Z26_16160 [Bacteroidota bacterium]|nr:hypothetical protein [Bacteroidota bacterium]
MPEKEKISSPSMGSNELGTETNETRSSGVSAGSDTQLHLAAAGGKKNKKNKNIDDDEKVIKNKSAKTGFPKSGETDE